MSERQYVLGTDDVEIERLGLQHRVWQPYVLDAWRRAGIAEGHCVVDLGCGPGHASFDLASIVGPAGRVIAVDQSRRFLSHLQRRADAEGRVNIELVDADINDPASRLALLDQIGRKPPFSVWCRWVLAFVNEPRDVLADLAHAMSPGSTIVLHEYYDYAAWQLIPRCGELEEFVAMVMASWRATGGEPDVGLKIPGWLTELGLEVTSTRSLVHVVPATDPIWNWPAAFVRAGSQRLVALGRLSADRAEEILRAFDAAAASPGVRLITPAVLEVIARKKKRVPTTT
jgi:SAM-dependent methyltransferase